MSKVLFLNVPAHGHVNPTLGLVNELVRQGEEVVYFCSEEFKGKIESAGAQYRNYSDKFNVFKNRQHTSGKVDINQFLGLLDEVLNSAEGIIEYILQQIEDIKFDYVVYGAMFPFGNTIAKILKIPAVASFAVFATAKELMQLYLPFNNEQLADNPDIMKKYEQLCNKLNDKYSIIMPEMMNLFFNKGDLNIAYTSKYFVSHIEYYDDSFIFIGPPIYDRKEKIEFPYEKIKDKKVVYISLGTVFNNTSDRLYEIFFETFADYDGIIVMAAYNIDISKFDIPQNFIVRSFVPQSEILKYTDVAITHAGMNSTSDLIYNNIPFVAIPIGADQPYMAGRAAELGAAISLDKDKLTPELLRTSVEKVLSDKSYLENIKKISDSFEKSGGYKRAVDEIFKLKKRN